MARHLQRGARGLGSEERNSSQKKGCTVNTDNRPLAAVWERLDALVRVRLPALLRQLGCYRAAEVLVDPVIGPASSNLARHALRNASWLAFEELSLRLSTALAYEDTLERLIAIRAVDMESRSRRYSLAIGAVENACMAAEEAGSYRPSPTATVRTGAQMAHMQADWAERVIDGSHRR
jgi:hypothetical protein